MSSLKYTKIEKNCARISASLLCAAPILCIFTPRIIGFLPMVLGVFSFVSYRLVYSKYPKLNSGFFAFSAVLIALSSLSALWSVDPAVSSERSLKLFLALVFGATFLSTLNLDVKSLLKARVEKYLPWSVLIAGICCLFEIYTDGLIYRIFHPEITSFNPAVLNRGTVFLVLCLPITLFLLQKRPQSSKIKYSLMALLCFVFGLIFVTADSQSSQVALVVSFAAYFLFSIKSKIIPLSLTALFCVGLVLSPWVASYMFNNWVEAVTHSHLLTKAFAANRMEIWDFVARRALEQPLWGHGIEATRAIKDFDTQQLYHESSHILHPHNFALQIWLEFGLIGVALFTGYFSYCVKLIQGYDVNSARVFYATFIGFLCVSSTAYGLWQGWWVGAAFTLWGLCLLTKGEDKLA